MKKIILICSCIMFLTSCSGGIRANNGNVAGGGIDYRTNSISTEQVPIPADAVYVDGTW